jgi:hypothetical protein
MLLAFRMGVNIGKEKRMCLARLPGYINEPYSSKQVPLNRDPQITASVFRFAHALMYGIPVRRNARSLNWGLLTGSVLLKGSSVPFLLAELRPVT